ncbi:MAG: winged helix-turn-helix domain-containing protein [Bryobacteraceae bacterium]
MSESVRNWREDLKVFRERMGGLTEQKKAMTKEQRDITKAIQEALKGGPRTVPEIAAHTGIPSHKVLWYVIAFKKYGEVAEVGQSGDYYQYAWKEASS